MKKPGRFLAPIVIAGITVGFLASAYKFVFSKSENLKQTTSQPQDSQTASNSSKNSN
ncbi:hypothetical protein MWMV17_MWMV17_03313 [Acinetobacter calcoaceticus]|uniref:Uncharacterized protein n=2 Tax=Acinetobacter calcoaceticus TaxID=471 RepID=A0A446ZMU8_ACICA|nr:hypothetical protein [Acinetobacter calcoaceticus]ENU08153.1 hypothetical protein F997_01592 [Acinetobacter calcoaceticus NIPH 13]ENV98078.1 hypothetical protein F936_03148 [Acinetobacter calcoaceticus DSM 30006 = CIP 81.8]CAI3161167.1 hypothetical protein MWMV17_MWMV17_03313 [Acinetobacter calcoaceticus]SUU52256.1 Uncharacterised protein [Acinetobacter calcoaceticus]VAX45760.1 Uncharacterised protein [Acinetobacter calcoaceticus]